MEIITNEKTGIVLYANLLSDIKTRIRQAQVKATLSANAEMIKMYLDIGRMIHKRQQQEGWSAAIIPHLSRDLRNELPEVKGFSERNVGRMLAFFRNYQNIESFLPQHVAKSGSSDFSLRPDAKLPLGDLILSIPWGHHIFDFLTLAEPFNERELETELVKHLEKFLIELGTGFAFVGRQYHLAISESEYELTRALPENLRSSLPSIEELEAELSGIHQEESGDE